MQSSRTSARKNTVSLDRQAFLEHSVKQVRKGFNISATTSNDSGMTLILFPTPDSLPVGALAETEPNDHMMFNIPGAQFPHIYPHPSVSLTCVVCRKPVPSCMKRKFRSNIRFIASSPAPFTAFCDSCIDEIL